jgi:hypothetical protein
LAPDNLTVFVDQREGEEMERAKNEIQELHAKEVGVGNPSEERASS